MVHRSKWGAVLGVLCWGILKVNVSFSAVGMENGSCVEVTSWQPNGSDIVVDLDTGAAHSVEVSPIFGTPTDFASPDGRFIASVTGDDHQLTLTDTPSGQTRAITQNIDWRVQWSPDSSHLAYVQFYPDRQYVDAFAVSVLRADTGEVAAAVIPGRGVDAPQVKWSPDGTRLAAVVNDADGARAAAYTSTGAAELETIASIDLGSAAGTVLTWSPSGRFIAFASNDGADMLLYSMETGTLQPLPFGVSSDRPFIDFSPDETYILTYYPASDHYAEFNAYDQHGALVWGGQLVQTSDDGYTPVYAWANDHAVIFSAWVEGLSDLVLADLVTGDSLTILADIRAWDLAPDRERLAVWKESSGLYLYELTTLTPSPVPIDAGLRDFVWSAHSQELIVLNGEGALDAYTPASSEWRRGIATVADGDVLQRAACDRVP
ncbi:MAG: WD40 repeat domain-containing protein [Anaerolineae bacterium]